MHRLISLSLLKVGLRIEELKKVTALSAILNYGISFISISNALSVVCQLLLEDKMRAKDNKTELIGFRLTSATDKAVKQAAYDSHRTVSNWVEVACMWALEQKVIPAVPRPK